MRNVLVIQAEAETIVKAIGTPPAGVRLIAVENAEAAMPYAAEAGAVVAMPLQIPQGLIDAMPHLEWVQVLTSGQDGLARLTLDPNVHVTSVSGVHGPQVSELVFLYMLAFVRDMRGMFTRQAEHRWQPSRQPLLSGQRLVVVGVGAIAEALAARAQAFGLSVTGVSGSRTEAPGFDRVLPMSALHDAAAEADFLVALTPLTPETTHLIDAKVLAAMAPHAVLINVARGKVVDEDALIDALAHNRIAGAGLDVFATEPLPPTSPLWGMDNVILTPHVAGWSQAFVQQVSPVVAGNLARWVSGTLS